MKRQRPSITSLVAFVLITSPLVYVLSYAPVVRMSGGDTVFDNEIIGAGDLVVADGASFPFFSPVDLIIDETPLRTPMLHWANLWGVRLEFEMGESIRHLAEHPSERELSNQQVANELAGLLRESGARGHGIEIEYIRGRASLDGEMESAEDRQTAVRIVLGHTSVSTVENHLDVRR